MWLRFLPFGVRGVPHACLEADGETSAGLGGSAGEVEDQFGVAGVAGGADLFAGGVVDPDLGSDVAFVGTPEDHDVVAGARGDREFGAAEVGVNAARLSFLLHAA